MALLSSIITPTNLVTANSNIALVNKTLTAPVINSPTGIVKGDVGLGNVDNTSDATKNAAAVALTNKTIDYANNTLTGVVGVTATQTLTNKTLTLPIIDNPKLGYTTTATAAGTTTLTVASNHQQFFTGVTTQTIVMPDVTTLTLGMSYSIENNSTGTLTVQSSGANTVGTISSGVTALCTCILTTGTTAASWDFDYIGFSALTGTGSVVLGTTPALTNPTVTNYTETANTANSSTAITLSLANGTVQIITLTGNATITMPTAVSGKSFTILLKQDATGSRTVTWSTVQWPSGTAPTITSTASKMDKYVFISDGTYWYGSNAGQNYTA